MSFCVLNLGCKVNRVESDAFAAQLLAQGVSSVGLEQADLVIVNTCTVTGEAEKKARKAVRRALRANDHATVLVTGCAAAIDPQAFRDLDPRVVVSTKGDLEERIARMGHACAESPLPVGAGFRTRVGVKVQDGCDNACTYCIVHVARGRSRSRSADEVAFECARLARAGVREIVLTGINLGAWRGENGEARLPDLLERLLEETASLSVGGQPACRFRLSSIEPRDVDGRLIDLMARENGRVCRHLHLPLQAGSDEVLRAMARPYTASRFLRIVEDLRKAMPTVSLSTDLIVGFPGETEAQFERTCEMARECGFSRLHVFPYSRREGTPAASREDQVQPEVKAARAARLRTLGEELRAEDRARRVGSVEWVLVEDGGHATTESYHEVRAPEGASPGDLVEAVL